jgi:hypothetical protein
VPGDQRRQALPLHLLRPSTEASQNVSMTSAPNRARTASQSRKPRTHPENASTESDAKRERGRCGSILSLGDASGADVVVGVPGVAEVGDLDDVAGVGGVDELAGADVDADVVEVVEKDEVSWLELVACDGRPVGVLGGSVVGQCSVTPICAKTYMTRPEQSKPVWGEAPPQR